MESLVVYPPDQPPAIEVPVGRTRVAMVDAGDADLVLQYRWHVHAMPDGRVYARARPNGGSVYMHRLIAATPAGFETDHRDGDGLNNRRSNLRTATASQNRANGAKQRRRGDLPPSSPFKGVHRTRDGYLTAKIKVNGQTRYLGTFPTEEAAARAYDAAARDAFGEFAQVNFPGDA